MDNHWVVSPYMTDYCIAMRVNKLPSQVTWMKLTGVTFTEDIRHLGNIFYDPTYTKYKTK